MEVGSNSWRVHRRSTIPERSAGHPHQLVMEGTVWKHLLRKSLLCSAETRSSRSAWMTQLGGVERLGDEPAVAVFVGPEDETTRGVTQLGRSACLLPGIRTRGRKKKEGKMRWDGRWSEPPCNHMMQGSFHQLDHMMASNRSNRKATASTFSLCCEETLETCLSGVFPLRGSVCVPSAQSISSSY